MFNLTHDQIVFACVVSLPLGLLLARTAWLWRNGHRSHSANLQPIVIPVRWNGHRSITNQPDPLLVDIHSSKD